MKHLAGFGLPLIAVTKIKLKKNLEFLVIELLICMYLFVG